MSAIVSVCVFGEILSLFPLRNVKLQHNNLLPRINEQMHTHD